MHHRPLTADGQGGHTVHPDIGYGSGNCLADVDEAVLYVLLGEVLAGKVQGMLALDDPLLGDIVERRGWLQGGDIGPQPSIKTHPVALLENAARILVQDTDSRVRITGKYAAGIHVEHEFVAPIDAQ